MPSKSKSQEDLMRAVAHSMTFAKKVGIPQKVGREFEAADKAKAAKFSSKSMQDKMYGKKKK